LKHIKNMENCKETRTDESKNCECMENEEVEEEKLPSSLNLVYFFNFRGREHFFIF